MQPTIRETFLVYGSIDNAYFTPQARYANSFQIGHNLAEVLLDFGECYEGDESFRVHTRIVCSPSHAKAFLALLQRALADYELAYGPLG